MSREFIMYGCIFVSGLMAGASLMQYLKNRMLIHISQDILFEVLNTNKEKLVHLTAELVVERVAPRVDLKMVAEGVVESVMNDYADEILDRVVDNILLEKE